MQDLVLLHFDILIIQSNVTHVFYHTNIVLSTLLEFVKNAIFIITVTPTAKSTVAVALTCCVSTYKILLIHTGAMQDK